MVYFGLSLDDQLRLLCRAQYSKWNGLVQMHFDALTLACVAAELQQSVAGGRVQQVLAPDAQSIGLEIYAARQRHYLLLTVGGRATRLHLVSQKLRRGVDQPSPLLLLLRKYIRDSVLDAVIQPEPTERVVQLRFDHAEHGTTTLLLEALGQRSNLLLLNPGGRILEALHRVWPGEGITRPQTPGQPYVPPTPQAKLPPVDDGSADYYTRLAAIVAEGGKLWQALVSGVAGISPSLGREVAWRVAGDTEAPAQGVELMGLIEGLQSLWQPVQTGEWEPGLWREGDQTIGFSPYVAHVRGEFVPTPSISQALEAFYGQPTTQGPQDAYAGLRTTVAAQLRRAEERVRRQLSALAGDEPPPGAAEALRTQAEWLLALHTEIKPGQTVFEVDLGEDSLRIPLDATRSPVEQAEGMFKHAGRMDRAAAFIPGRRVKLESDLAFVAQLQADLALAENQPEIAAVRAELQKSGLLPTPQKKTPPAPRQDTTAHLHRFLSPQGFEIVVGRNAHQNEQVTFEVAGSSDLWLHVRDAPGSHVVIRNGGQRVNEETLRMAAQLAAYYSSLRGERAAVVAYTPRRNVSRAPGGRTGQVLVRQEQTITVRAELPENAEHRT
jgi:predicted ribosome quality control (RQC) complex YloA/Tae2 family protein